jgi:hypothetical protein
MAILLYTSTWFSLMSFRSSASRLEVSTFSISIVGTVYDRLKGRLFKVGGKKRAKLDGGRDRYLGAGGANASRRVAVDKADSGRRNRMDEEGNFGWRQDDLKQWGR